MPRTLSAHFLPALTTADELAGGVVVVIDVLRATTTITTALAAGAHEILPCLEIDEARRKAAELKAQLPLLGGERHGKPIEGFDLGSSPSEYTAATIGGRTIVFTTTNGTKAMQSCRRAKAVLIGAFVNVSAVARRLSEEPMIHLLCAGTDGDITREDVLFAGAVTEKLCEGMAAKIELNDQARIARAAWRQLKVAGDRSDSAGIGRLAETLRHTHGGRNLLSIGLANDIDDAAQIDRYDFVPVLDVKGWRITKANS